jgi:hypothetical protein
MATDREAARQLQEGWRQWFAGVPLRIVPSPYREVVGPLLDAVGELRAEHPECTVTVMLAERIPRHWWQEPLHNQAGLALKLALLYTPGVVVTSVPTHL